MEIKAWSGHYDQSVIVSIFKRPLMTFLGISERVNNTN